MAMNTNGKKILGFADFWHERLFLRYPSEFHKSPTKTERGQLKQLADKVGPETREVMVYAVDNWLECAEKANSVKGLAVYPTRPKIGFLLAYCDVVVNLMRQAMARKKAKAEADQARAEMEARIAKTAQEVKPQPVPMTEQERYVIHQEWRAYRDAGGTEFKSFKEYMDYKEASRVPTSERWLGYSKD